MRGCLTGVALGVGALVVVLVWPWVWCGKCGRFIWGPRYGAHVGGHVRDALGQSFSALVGDDLGDAG